MLPRRIAVRPVKLTFMATLTTLIASGALRRWALDDLDARMPVRTVAVCPQFEAWLETECPDSHVDRDKAMTPCEQVVDALDRLVVDAAFPHAGMLVNITPQAKGVYELKTTDVRIFGFFPGQSQFVATAADLKKRLKAQKQRIQELHARTVETRQDLGLGFLRHRLSIRDELL
jgi:hypothetical protein